MSVPQPVWTGAIGGTTATRAVYGPDLIRVDCPTGTGCTGAITHDIHGSALETTATTAVTADTTYSPWGDTTTTFTQNLDYGYRSELHTGATIHLRARDYDPETGLFLQPDPLDGVDGTTTVNNPYHYTNNDPINSVDPTGLRPADGDFDDPCAGNDPEDTGRMGSYLGSELDGLGLVFGLHNFDDDTCYQPKLGGPNYEVIMCGFHPIECLLGDEVANAASAETDRLYATSGLSADGSRRNSFLHILLASTLTVTFASASSAREWLLIHEIQSPHPVQPRLNQVDKANNVYGVAIGEPEIGALNPMGSVGLAADVYSAPQNVEQEIESFVEHLSPMVKRFVDRGLSCELINPTSEDAFTKNAFVEPSRCGYL